jgi:adenosine deaminase
VALGIYPTFRQHPVGQLYDRGVKVTVSTDDPPFFHTTMAREYDMLNRAFDWDEGVFAAIARTSLDAAFCDADTKAKLVRKLEAADA